MNFLARAGGGVLSLCLGGDTLAAEAPMAVVNGVPIAARLLDINVEANLAQGQKDTPELRTALKQELIARELMVQEAQKTRSRTAANDPRRPVDLAPKFVD